MRLIDADAIEKTLVDFATKTFRKFCISEDAVAESLVIVGVTMDLKEIISKAPTVEMRPIGRWMECGSDGKPADVIYDEEHTQIPLCSVICSECGEWLVASDEYAVIGNFCPNCGADMRGNHDKTKQNS